MKLLRPLKNESGVAMIGLIVVVTAGVLSYTAFTASSYMMMMTEAKRQKRLGLAFEIVSQFATIVTRARQDMYNGGEACPGGTAVGNFCFQLDGGATEDCVENPMTGNPICIGPQVPVGSSPAPTVPIAVIQPKYEPNFIRDDIIIPIRDFNRWYGKHAIMVAKAITDEAPVAHAKIRQINIPALAAPAAYTIPPTACAPADQPNSTCMTCQESAFPPGGWRPACIRLKICVVLGGCAAGNEDEWLWQTIAVTSPLIQVP